MLKLFKIRLLSICTATILLTACASDGGSSTTNHSSSSTSSSSTTHPNLSYNQPRNNTNDIWQRVRNSYGMSDLYNDEVLAKENYYAQRTDYVDRMATRSGDFMYIIMDEVEKRKMPSEIALLPFVESAFVTTAQSPVKAAGLWQFMPATGRDFALQQNHFADQRNDVVASTNAALTFLQRLYDQFGDWHLALAAYNWGPGNVSKAVNRAQANGLSGSYTDIKMPAETRQYVPKLQAIKNIINNPSQYGITLPNIANNLRHEVVTITRDIDLATAARLANMDVENFKKINPAYKKSIIAASLGAKILVPTNHAETFRNALNDSSTTLASLTTYSTYNTESLDDIAAKFNTHADNLRYLNSIPTNHLYVNAGSAILVPRTSSQSSQDIPYEALTAGLSTSSGGIGLGGGIYIEQPTLFAQDDTDEYTRQQRSGIAANTLSNTSIGNNKTTGLIVTNHSNDDDLGLLIKNTANDPKPANNTLLSPSSPSWATAPYSSNTNVTSTDIPTVQEIPVNTTVIQQTPPVALLATNSAPITQVATFTPEISPATTPVTISTASNLVVQTPEPTALPVTTVVSNISPTNDAITTPTVTTNTIETAQATVTLDNSALATFVPTPEEILEVEKSIAIAKPSTTRVKPKAAVKTTRVTTSQAQILKVVTNSKKAKIEPIPVEVKPIKTKTSAIKTNSNKTDNKKVIAKTTVKESPKESVKPASNMASKVTTPHKVSKTTIKSTEKTTEKIADKTTLSSKITAAKQPIPTKKTKNTTTKETVVLDDKRKKPIKK